MAPIFLNSTPQNLRSERLAEARTLDLEIMVHTPLKDETVFRTALTAKVDYLNIDYPDIASQLRSELQNK